MQDVWHECETEMQDAVESENVRQLVVMSNEQFNLSSHDLQSDMIPKF